MYLKQTLDVLNGMVADRIVSRYAIGGAVAAIYYIEPVLTADLDVFVPFETSAAPQTGLVTLAPILGYLAERGFDRFEKEGVMIGNWPVQFLPVVDALDAEALDQAQEIVFEDPSGPVPTFILRPEHLVAIALRVGRPKDFERIHQFLERKAVNMTALEATVARHGLEHAWQRFQARSGI